METLKVKTSELIAVRDEAAQLLSKEKISFLAKFKVADVHKSLVAKLETFESTRKQIIEQFGSLDEKKENYIIPEEKQEEFKKEIQSLLDADIEFQFEPLDLSIFAKLETENTYYQVFKLFKAA
jgi:hypothetical protein